jgi:hypothetical protein
MRDPGSWWLDERQHAGRCGYMGWMRTSASARAALVFGLSWCGAVASALLGVMPAAAACAAVGLAAWWTGMRASYREGRARLADHPSLSSGQARQRVARGLLLSWLVPGLGELYLGPPRRRALTRMIVFFAVATPTWAAAVPVWLGVLFATPVWVWGQHALRERTGWGWSPLMPTWGELLPRAR